MDHSDQTAHSGYSADSADPTPTAHSTDATRPGHTGGTAQHAHTAPLDDYGRPDQHAQAPHTGDAIHSTDAAGAASSSHTGDAAHSTDARRAASSDQTTHAVHIQSAAEMSPLADRSVDLVVTSPPYPMIEMWDGVFAQADPAVADALDNTDAPRAFELMHRVLDPVWRECARVLKPGAFLCINIGDATRTLGDDFRRYANHARITRACEELGLSSLPLVLWRKQTNAPNKFMGSGMLPAGAYVTLEHEHILIFRNGGKRRFPSPAERERRRRSAFFWEERNEWFSDIWDFKGTPQRLQNDETRARSAAFPFELAYRLICMYSLRGDLVLDPFLGTGTTTVAAIAAARNSAGFEIEPGFRPAVAELVRASAPQMNRRVADRLEAHLAFVRESARRGRTLKHVNAPFGFPVMTRQETSLELDTVRHIELTPDGHFTATHHPTSAHFPAAADSGPVPSPTTPQLTGFPEHPDPADPSQFELPI